MSRVAVNSNSYGGMSRLPRPVGQGQLGSQQPRVQNGGSNGSRKPSKLEQLQVDYQKNIMKEKEQKLISLFEDNQQRALQKVNQGNNGKGMLRDFFQERRAMGSGNRQNHNQPSMENMYHRKKMEIKTNPQSVPGRATSYNPGPSQKQSAGRDRSNLLAPISGQRKNVSPGNPFPNKAQIVRPRTYKDVSYNNTVNRPVKNLPSSAPTGQMVTDSSDDDSPPPNPQQLQMLQQKRLMMKNKRNNQPTIHQPQPTAPKQTDFQKWQEEQNQNRSNRLKKYRDVNANVAQKQQYNIDDEGFDDDSVESDEVDVQEEINNKQALLLQQIEEQQRELERLKYEREREDIEEKKERARRKKMEEERKRREKVEEERRRKQEEDERVMRTLEEEKSRKMAEEKQRLRNTSHTSKYEYEDSAEEEEEEEHFQLNATYKKTSPPPHSQHKPSAPSKPKPTTTRKYHPPKSRTPPMPQGDHIALYQDADNMEGAFENVGKLVSCFNCGRKFAEDRIKKHEKFCKNATKKRKVLDPSKLRTQGTEMAQYVGKKQNNPKPKKSNWRDKHESFMNAIKYAKKCKQIEEQGGSLADLPPPPRSENPDYVQCPHCTRRFNPQTAERHIPHCKNARSRPAPLKRK